MKTPQKKKKIHNISKKNNIKNNVRNSTKIKNKINGGRASKTKSKLKKINCSPKPKGEMNEFTCYTNKSLYKLRDLWNERHPDAKINSNNSKEIHSLLTKKLEKVCNTESCWLKQNSEFGKINDLSCCNKEETHHII